LGTLCLVDIKPMEISAEELDRLQDTAKVISTALETK
jgi:hypothetical protein